MGVKEIPEGRKIKAGPTFLFPLWNYDEEGRSAGGPVRPLGFITNQNRMAVPTWSYAMEVYPPARIIEIGAYNGGFTCALAVHAWNIGARVFSFDRQQIPNTKYKELADFLGISWMMIDVFSDAAVTVIRDLIQLPGVSYVLCDGGDKSREMNLFAPALKAGDVIGAHDYFVGRHDWWGWEEVYRRDLNADVFEVKFEPFLQDHFDAAAWLVYRRR